MSSPRNILLALRWYHPKIHRGVARYAREAGWHLNADLSRTQSGLEYWDGDGIITQPKTDLPTPLDGLLEALPQPQVIIGHHLFGNNEETGRLAAEHFHDLGVRSVATLGLKGIDHMRLTSCKKEAKAFADVAEIFVDKHAPWPKRQGSLVEQIRILPKPVAIFAVNDDIGAWAIEACLSAGIAVPDEVAVLGVRNDELLCEALAVPLSSIENNVEEFGYQAAAMLDRHLDGEPLPKTMLEIPPRGVVVRQSTDVLAIAHPQVLRAMQFIQRNLTKQFSVGDVVRATAMSQRGLYKAFSDHLGRSIHETILHERLKLAKDRLLSGNDTIDSIALQAGFSDARHLHRIFRQATGMTPREWVESHRPKKK